MVNSENNVALGHAKRIAIAMQPDPKNWEYRGEIFYDEDGKGKCECGHNIAYIFPIYNKTDARALSIGSVCIDLTIPYLINEGNEGLAEALTIAKEKLVEILKAKQKEIRDKKNIIKYNKAKKDAKELYDWFIYLQDKAIEDIKKFGPRYVSTYNNRPVYRLVRLPKYFYQKKYKALILEPDCTTIGRKAGSLNRRMKTFHNNTIDLMMSLKNSGVENVWTDPPFFGEEIEMVDVPDENENLSELAKEIEALIGKEEYKAINNEME